MPEAEIVKLLVIEEDEVTCDSLRKHFFRLGCRVTVTHTAESGIEELAKSSYTAVFAGLTVRRQGGRKVARWVRENAPGTKTFLITSWKGELEGPLLMHDGVTDIIRKPLQFNEIKIKMLEHLGISDMPNQLS